jgi:hypoxanthine phosphoribosyltransferase
MKKLRYVSWLDFVSLMDDCVEAIKKMNKDISIIYAIPRGGFIPSVILSHALNVDIGWVNSKGYVLIVDDIIDSGVTHEKHIEFAEGRIFFAPYYKKDQKEKTIFAHPNGLVADDEWIVFPWEQDPKNDSISLTTI